MTAQLYCFGESGNAYKAALTAALSGYDWEPRFVDFFAGENRTPEFRAMNVMGEAPVLVDGDKSHLIRERGTYETLIEGEHIPRL